MTGVDFKLIFGLLLKYSKKKSPKLKTNLTLLFQSFLFLLIH